MKARWMILGAFVLLPGAVAAQGTDSVPRVAIGAGAGLALPFHGDFDFTPWAWDADLRVALARHALLEAAVGEWRHSETSVAQNIQVTIPPGTIGRLERTTTRVQRILQANLLFTAADRSRRQRSQADDGSALGIRRLGDRIPICSTPPLRRFRAPALVASSPRAALARCAREARTPLSTRCRCRAWRRT